MPKYCENCGKEMALSERTCQNCGYSPSTPTPVTSNSPEDKANIALSIISFFLPIVGLILWIVYRKEKPTAANSYGIWALVGVIINCILIAI